MALPRRERDHRPATGGFFVARSRERTKGHSMTYLIVFLGGGVGAALRHGVNILCARLLGTQFPYGTLTVNVTGSLIMGLLVAWFAFKGDVSQHWRLFLTTGVLGGYTTFSTFSLDAAVLYERGTVGLAGAYVLASVVVGIVGLFAGLYLVRHFS
jgi:CrcB protein